MIKIFILLALCAVEMSYSKDVEADGFHAPESNISAVVSRFGKIGEKIISTTREVKDGNLPKRGKKLGNYKLILNEGSIFFNGKKLLLGASLDTWKNSMPGIPRCFGGGVNLCVWDDIGLEIGTDHKSSQRVTFFSIYLNFSEFDKDPSNLTFVDGAIEKKVEDWFPKNVFNGYLELNGFEIDAQTKFWEIRAGAKGKKPLHCGLRECSHPSGGFGDGARIDLMLDGTSEEGLLRRFSVSLIEE